MSETPAHRPFAKIPRLRRDILITEKLDGTNAVIYVGEDGEVRAGSRNRWLSGPGNDHFGFAGFVARYREVFQELGPGYHYGEWWGLGIGRGYGLTERRLSFFHPRCADFVTMAQGRGLPVSMVPHLYQGPFLEVAIEEVLERLRTYGSMAARGFMRPEGVVVFHTASGGCFKVTLEHDAGKEVSTR